MLSCCHVAPTSLLHVQVLEERASDLERDGLVKDARAKSLREAMHLQETKILSLQQTLAEVGREAAAARQRAVTAEERAVAAEQVGVEHGRECTEQLRAENTKLGRQIHEAETRKIVRSLVRISSALGVFCTWRCAYGTQKLDELRKST
jgi:hypothetical protein